MARRETRHDRARLFALGGRQDDDAEILALFREWIEGQRAQRRICKADPSLTTLRISGM